MARTNQFAVFANKPDPFSLLIRIDNCFQRICTNLINSKKVISALLLLRSHSAYRAACGLCCGGHVAEVFPLLRSLLEYAGYALLISETAGLNEIWLNRHDNKTTQKRVRDEFVFSKIRAAISTKDARLADVYEDFYNRFIDFGGHPNERAVTGSLKIDATDSQTILQQLYLHGDGLPLDHALKSTAQAGLCSLHIFQHIFTTRFNLLGVKDEIIELRKRL